MDKNIKNINGVINIDPAELSVKALSQYVANFESYIARMKEIHWSCDNDKTHVLTNDFIPVLSKTQDEIAEYLMGAFGTKFPLDFLSIATPIKETTLPSVLHKLIVDTIKIHKEVDKNPQLLGIESILKELLIEANQCLYKETQK